MTKIKENKKLQRMQLHIAKAYEIINEHLPEYYVDDVQKKLPEVSKGNIRNVRNQSNKLTENKLNILNALVEVAKENQLQKEKLIEITK